ncbi:MAG TPA: 4-alpha-glucanotransferase [Kofleriaceae bacterium]|nr:4-alpha-glucanotransferase [Kofleriaceae bacterium]
MRAALARLGIDWLVVSIHQASFPAGDDDIGYGTPYSARADQLLGFLAGLGVNGVALGPGGITSRDDPSPYTSSALSHNPLHVSLGELAGRGLIGDEILQGAVAGRPDGDRVAYRYAWDTQRRLLAAAAATVRAGAGAAELEAARARLSAAAPWIAAEARFEAIASALGNSDWQSWPDDPPLDADAALPFELAQLLVAEQHAALRERARGRGLSVLADLAAGISGRDRWVLPRVFGELFLPGWAMGAPPSRTNPDGQPWEFPVLDPRQLADGGARRFLTARIDLLLDGHDGLRIDHPHGWICPWVYRTGQPVAGGARLFESPDMPDLAGFARVRGEQLDAGRPRHDDDWVRALEPAQASAYAVTFDLLVERVRARGGDPSALMVEVLSTCPRPLAAVLGRHELGRFRVTQKARVDQPGDVYRGDRAARSDWVMVGNHDTAPLRAVIAGWRGTQEVARRAAYLGERLRRPAAELERDERALATAMMAELFLGPARHALVFWPDLFGIEEPFNQPGTVNDRNWSLRVPADFEDAHARAVASGAAPDLGEAAAWALEARGLAGDDEGRDIARRLRG